MDQKMKIFPDSSFKDDTPVNTVERIKGILAAYGIETAEEWNESGVPYCHSVRVSVFGTEFGTNGKGVTREFALASGYGELMERLQIGNVLKLSQQKDGTASAQTSGDGSMSAGELLERNRKWYSAYAERLEAMTGVKLTEEEILSQYTDENGNVAVTAFYCVNTKTQEYLPTQLLRTVYTANGCAAGNTMEEALVQAISEIQERHISNKIVSGRMELPDVPEDVLRSCATAYEIISYLRERNFRVVVKDCSMGTGFPVVCVLLIDEKTGRYHTHFGAYPHFEIALQRTLTETFQGRNINHIARFDSFIGPQNGTFDLANMMNQLVKGTAEKHPELFLPAEQARYTPSGFAGKNNRELLDACVEMFSRQGYDILVRDHSCLGFPTCQVVIPGYSEIFTHRLAAKLNDIRYQGVAQRVLRDPAAASFEDIMGYMMNKANIQKRKIAQGSFSVQANLPARLDGAQDRYLMNATQGYINYAMGRKADVIKNIEKMLPDCPEQDAQLLVCIKRYLSLGADGYGQEKIRAVLDHFHRPETVAYLYDTVAQSKNPMERFVLHCDMKCADTCPLYSACRKDTTDTLVKLIHTKQRELDQGRLQDVFA